MKRMYLNVTNVVSFVQPHKQLVLNLPYFYMVKHLTIITGLCIINVVDTMTQ